MQDKDPNEMVNRSQDPHEDTIFQFLAGIQTLPLDAVLPFLDRVQDMILGPHVMTAEGEEFVPDLDAGLQEMQVSDSGEIHHIIQFKSEIVCGEGKGDDRVSHGLVY